MRTLTRISGNVLKLKLATTADAKTIAYLVDKKWDHKTVLYERSGIATRTFCDVPLEPVKPTP